ncbi:MAG: Asp-tRNA(Asn)/Glu-tRNA(Gln) amidotransferase subunit GatC [Humidesulfovibrio sp.]|jgi:aspartyl-tRNA(Asn)/glutamyl-tRNA(Gln) amidotransferase subunit C|uniref:Asp-tRNA(Asn)/Glu-tRNA(Gln) amidotransferase subunit GatC n=1 Tax=Humidesulfovibrio sp. TaxID=2910988 RepID=UPI0027334806|nr:Asp-tRNA(Asn)/Glu-tRNA(Gln) amidotransferase subunit GatC [Humidesulfovibrio sp.]MDP2847394.1 Asp-tRNA(Asn)/Glu-tRNA(Gln) amidotransferase subunit GatC [Humidesulfovibrio sp.]
MKISPEQVAKVAKLSRLELSQEKIGQYAEQLGGILGYMDKLAELDTQNVEPMYTPVDQVSVMRDDVVRKDYAREDILKNAPETDGAFFIVPRIV